MRMPHRMHASHTLRVTVPRESRAEGATPPPPHPPFRCAPPCAPTRAPVQRLATLTAPPLTRRRGAKEDRRRYDADMKAYDLVRPSVAELRAREDAAKAEKAATKATQAPYKRPKRRRSKAGAAVAAGSDDGKDECDDPTVNQLQAPSATPSPLDEESLQLLDRSVFGDGTVWCTRAAAHDATRTCRDSQRMPHAPRMRRAAPRPVRPARLPRAV